MVSTPTSCSTATATVQDRCQQFSVIVDGLELFNSSGWHIDLVAIGYNYYLLAIFSGSKEETVNNKGMTDKVSQFLELECLEIDTLFHTSSSIFIELFKHVLYLLKFYKCYMSEPSTVSS